MKKILILLLIFISSCNKNIDDSPKDIKYIQKTIQYQSIDSVKSNLSSLDINYFENWDSLKPVVIFVHGGGWAIGDKTNKPKSKNKLFEDLKFVYVSINYRLSPFPYQPNNPNRIIHPTHVEDVAKAIKYVYNSIENYGGDKNKMVIMGHSAGAHLASLVASDPKYLNKFGLNTDVFKGAISLDTQASDIYYAMQHTFEGSGIYKMFINAFGKNADDWKDASPINYTSLSKVSNWVVVYRGSHDRITNQLRYIDTLNNSGKQVIGIDASSYSHSGVNDAIGDEQDNVINKAVVEFLNSVLK